jgi:hypothetical protein
LGKLFVRLPTFLPAGTQHTEHDPHVTRLVQQYPVSVQPVFHCELSPLDVAILSNKNDVMTELVQVWPLVLRIYCVIYFIVFYCILLYFILSYFYLFFFSFCFI